MRRWVTAATAPIMGSAVLDTMGEGRSPIYQHSHRSAPNSEADTRATAPVAGAHKSDGFANANGTLTTHTHHQNNSAEVEGGDPAPTSPSLVTTPSSIAATASAAVGSLAEACQALHSTASSFAAPLLLWAMPEPAGR